MKFLLIKSILATSLISSLTLVSATEDKNDNHVTVFASLSGSVLDWSSPQALYKSVKASSTEHTGTNVGHVYAQINCTDSNGKLNSFWTGMNGLRWEKDAKKALIIRGQGLGILFTNSPGYLTDTDETRDFLFDYPGRAYYAKESSTEFSFHAPRFVRLKVDANRCDRVMDYYNTFNKANIEKKLGFGLSADPFEQYSSMGLTAPEVLEAGCSSFGAGLLRAAGFWDDIIETHMMTKVHIAESWIGGKAFGLKRVKKFFSRIKSDEGKSWSKAGAKTKLLNFYDPEKMWHFIKNSEQCSVDMPQCKYPEISTWTKNFTQIKPHYLTKIELGAPEDSTGGFHGVEVQF